MIRSFHNYCVIYFILKGIAGVLQAVKEKEKSGEKNVKNIFLMCSDASFLPLFLASRCESFQNDIKYCSDASFSVINLASRICQPCVAEVFANAPHRSKEQILYKYLPQPVATSRIIIIFIGLNFCT